MQKVSTAFLIAILGISPLSGAAAKAMDMDMGDMSGMQNMPGMQMTPPPPSPAAPNLKPPPTAVGKSYALTDLERMAHENNPTLVQARAQIKGEKGKALQAGLPPNPFVSYVGDLMGVRSAGLGEFQGGMAGQEVILGGKLKYSRKKYLARMSAAEQQALAQEFRVINDVRVSYYQVLAAAQRLSLQQEMLKSASDRWITTHEMLNMGQANQVDLHAANIMLEKQKLKVLTAENELTLSWQQLTTVVGIDAPYQSLTGSLEDVLAELSWDPLLKKLLDESPELGEAKRKLKADEITVQRERRQPIPDVVMCGGAGYDQLDKSFAARASFSIVNIPVWNRNQGTIMQAQADLSRQHAQVKLVELSLRRRLAWQYAQYRTAMQHVDAYKTVIVPEARQKYQVSLTSYRDTRLEWPPVLEAQRDYLNCRLEYIDNLLALKESTVELEGFLLSGGLIPPAGVTPPGHIDATPQPR